MRHLIYIAQQLVDPGSLPQPKADEGTINTIYRIFYVTLGAATVLLFIYAGFRYIIAQGDPQKITQAKTRLMHITIGLAIAASAGIIVKFIIDKFG